MTGRIPTQAEPTWGERNGELMAVVLGAVVFGFALALLVVGLVIT